MPSSLCVKKLMNKKNFWPEKNLMQKNIQLKKKLVSNKILGQKIEVKKNFKNIWVKIIRVKILGQTTFYFEEMFGPRKCFSNKMLGLGHLFQRTAVRIAEKSTVALV